MTLSYGPLRTDVQVSADQQELIYKMFCTDTGCSLEDLLEVMDDQDEWQKRKSEKSVLAA